jgi:hypothetical protein
MKSQRYTTIQINGHNIKNFNLTFEKIKKCKPVNGIHMGFHMEY